MCKTFSCVWKTENKIRPLNSWIIWWQIIDSFKRWFHPWSLSGLLRKEWSQYLLLKSFLVISLDTAEHWSKKSRNLPRTDWQARRSVGMTADSLLVMELWVFLTAVICKYYGDLNQIHATPTWHVTILSYVRDVKKISQKKIQNKPIGDLSIGDLVQ